MSSATAATSSSCAARLVSLEQARALPVWRDGLAHLAKDHRWYEIIADTLSEFECAALLLTPSDGEAYAVQPLFFVDQDLVAAGPVAIRRIVGVIREVAPRFLRWKMLMVGCAAGEGHVAIRDRAVQRRLVETARPVLQQIARERRASLIVWKDFPQEYRPLLRALEREGNDAFVRVPSMPATQLALNFTSFDDYVRRHLSRVTRKSLRRKFRATADVPIKMKVTTDIEDCVDEMLSLYEQVRERSRLKFERLTREFFLQLAARMPDRVRFFLWKLDGRLVAFNLCLVHDGAISDEYLGLDYSVALDLHLYFVTFRDVVQWSIDQGLKTYYSTPLNYDPKLHLGFELTPLDLYAASPNPMINPMLRRALRWVQPTRSEPALLRFPNAAELVG